MSPILGSILENNKKNKNLKTPNTLFKRRSGEKKIKAEKDKTIIMNNSNNNHQPNYDDIFASTPNQKYSGDLILREIAILDQIETGGTKLALLIIIGRTLIYLLIQALNYDQIGNYSALDYYMFFGLILITWTVHLLNLMFIVFGVVDFRRKLFFQKMMTALIDPERSLNEKGVIKSIPIINILCPNNLRRWMHLRKSSLDLGRKYTYRVFLYSSIFIGLYGLIAVYLTLTLFQILNNKIPLSVYLIGYYDVFVIIGIMIHMINIGAEVNSYFSHHKDKFLCLKSHFINIRINYENLIKMRTFTSHSLKLIIVKFKEMNMNEEKRNDRIEKCLAAIDLNIEILDHDVEHGSLKLLGITCSYEVINSIYTAIFSLLLASGQYVYNKIRG